MLIGSFMHKLIVWTQYNIDKNNVIFLYRLYCKQNNKLLYFNRFLKNNLKGNFIIERMHCFHLLKEFLRSNIAHKFQGKI
jgi:hypothetical protein